MELNQEIQALETYLKMIATISVLKKKRNLSKDQFTYTIWLSGKKKNTEKSKKRCLIDGHLRPVLLSKWKAQKNGTKKIASCVKLAT